MVTGNSLQGVWAPVSPVMEMVQDAPTVIGAIVAMAMSRSFSAAYCSIVLNRVSCQEATPMMRPLFEKPVMQELMSMLKSVGSRGTNHR